MASTEIAVRHVVRFGYRATRVDLPLPSPLPKNTLDPRYVACVQHRTACDCREAEHAENIAELKAEHQAIKQAFEELLRGHATWVEPPGRNGLFDRRLQCQCTGCQIARRVYLGYANTVVLGQPEPQPTVTLVFAPLRNSGDEDDVDVDVEVPF